MLEKTIEDAFVNHCALRGIQCLKLRIDGRNGFPDRTVLTSKGAFFVEFKTPTGRLSKQQEKEISRLRSDGYVVLVADKIGQAESLLKEFMK